MQAKEQCQRAHFWVLVAPERHVLYRYSARHDSKAVDHLLAGYKGYLVADAQETLKQDETQQRLAANVFRRIALGEHPVEL